MFQRYAIYRIWRLYVPVIVVLEEFSRQKKERRHKPPLSCRSIGTPLMVDCRSSKAFPTLSSSSVLCPGSWSRDFYSRLLYRRLLAFRFRRVAPAFSSVSRTCAPFTSRLFRLAPSELRTFCCRSCFRSRSFKAEASPIF